MCSLQIPSFRGFDHSPFNRSFSSSTKRLGKSESCSSFWGKELCLSNELAVEKRLPRRRISRVIAMSASNVSSFKMNLNEYMVVLEKPLGIRFALSVDGKIFVHALKKGGNAEKSRIVMVGDTLKKAGESSSGSLTEIKDFGDIEKMMQDNSGSCSLVLERPFSPFPIHQLYLMDDVDILFNRGRVPVVTWNKNLLSSNLRTSCESSGNSGFASFSSKFLTSQGWEVLDSQNENREQNALNNTPPIPFSPLVNIFCESNTGDAEWAHGSFPLEEYIKALDRSKGELYYNHALGMRYSKITEQIYVGSCIQREADVEMLSNVVVRTVDILI